MAAFIFHIPKESKFLAVGQKFFAQFRVIDILHCDIFVYRHGRGGRRALAQHAAVAALWPSTMNTGSMRIEPKATCDDDNVTGTNKLEHSDLLGTMLR